MDTQTQSRVSRSHPTEVALSLALFSLLLVAASCGNDTQPAPAGAWVVDGTIFGGSDLGSTDTSAANDSAAPSDAGGISDASGTVDSGAKIDAMSPLDVTEPDDAAASDTASSDAGDLDAKTSSDGGVTTDTGASPDTFVATCPGGPGCSCAAPPDCNNGLCIDTPLGRRCAMPCTDTCPIHEACLPLKDNAGKTVLACVPGWGRLCQPCDASKDCEAAGIKGALCVDEGPQGRYCGAACQSTTDCPEGYGCQVVSSTEGTKSKQCVRLPKSGSTEPFGVCACWPVSKADGLSTKCYAVQKDLNGQVVGKCPGQKICGPSGPAKCILVGVKAEICDGVDNDCNDLVDDQAGGCAANESCIKGKCTQSCTAVDGGWSAWVWGACSAACGGGQRKATRACTNPLPSCGGKPCPGSDTQTENCNTQPCGPGTLPKGTSVYSKGGETITGTVPAGVSSATVSLWGAGGGGGYPGAGGGGAWVKVKFSVKTGDTLQLRIASGGQTRGGGGGASYLSKNGVILAVSAGGGGAGCDGCSGCSEAKQPGAGAGGGGGKVGGAGQDGTPNNKYGTNSGEGKGATSTKGGLGGKQTNQSSYSGCEANGYDGAKDAGGACAGGSQCKIGPASKAQMGGSSCKGNGTGGAGGSGYYGGGSGAAKYTYSGGGGGGGSSWVDVSAQLLDSAAGKLAIPGNTTAPHYTAAAGRGGLGIKKSFSGKPEAGNDGLIVLTL